MIKFTARAANGRQIAGFGITEKNVEQLKKGYPIMIWGHDIGVPFDIMIYYGETEQILADQLRDAGMIDPNKTVIHDTSQKPKTRQ